MITLQRFLSNRRRAQAMLDLKRRRKPALIVTLEGQHTHTVRYLFEDDVALTHCGMRVPDAKHLIGAATELRITPGCANCDRTLRGAKQQAGPREVKAEIKAVRTAAEVARAKAFATRSDAWEAHLRAQLGADFTTTAEAVRALGGFKAAKAGFTWGDDRWMT